MTFMDGRSYLVRKTLAPAFQMATPNYSTCGRCALPWSVVSSRTVMYRDNGGCFALCQSCWDELGSAESRLPYYLALIPMWVRTTIDSTAEHVRELEGQSDAIAEGVYRESGELEES